MSSGRKPAAASSLISHLVSWSGSQGVLSHPVILIFTTLALLDRFPGNTGSSSPPSGVQSACGHTETVLSPCCILLSPHVCPKSAAVLPTLSRAPTQLKLRLGGAGPLPFRPEPPAFPTRFCLLWQQLSRRLLSVTGGSSGPFTTLLRGCWGLQRPDSGSLRCVLCLRRGHLLFVTLGRWSFPRPVPRHPVPALTSPVSSPVPRLRAADSGHLLPTGSSSALTDALPGGWGGLSPLPCAGQGAPYTSCCCCFGSEQLPSPTTVPHVESLF